MADEKLVDEAIENLTETVKVIYKKDNYKIVYTNAITTTVEAFDKFRSVYEELTGDSVHWKDIPKSLQRSFLTSKPLSGQAFIKLPKTFGAAYFIARKPPDNVILNKIKKRLASYEDKYGISSEEFYRKYHNSESVFDGNQEQVLDFLMWQSYYEEYLELENVSG